MSLKNLFRILHVLGTDINQVWPGEIVAWAEEVSGEFIEEWVERAKADQPRLATMDDVLEAVAHVYDVLVRDLRSPSRKRLLAEARKAAAVLVKESPFLKLVDLSYRLHRDVSSLSHSLRRAYDRVVWDAEMAQRFRQSRRRMNRLTRKPRPTSLVTGKTLQVNLRHSEQTGLMGAPLPDGAKLEESFPESKERDPSQIWTVVDASRVDVLQFYEREMVHAGWRLHHELTQAYDRLVFARPPAKFGVVVDLKWKDGTRFLLIGSEDAGQSHWEKRSNATLTGVRCNWPGK